ncbi:MAG: PAS domain-containing protein [Bryobacteraceae bacterium]
MPTKTKSKSRPKTAKAATDRRAAPKAPSRRTATLYSRLGGASAIGAAVDGLYRRILADPGLMGLFEHTAIDKLKSQQRAFLAQALGGPRNYRGADMRSAHANLAINQTQFDAVAAHLIDTLAELAVPSSLIDEVVAIAASLAGDIVTVPANVSRKDSPMSNFQQSDRSAATAAPDLTTTLAGMRGALEALGTNVFIADRDLRLVYMNERARRVLGSMRDQLQQSFGISVEEMIGTQIDRFHGSRAKQIRRVLSDLDNLPIRSEIRLGELILDLNVNPIVDDRGEYCGLVVNWEEISEKKRLERNAARSQSMVENAPINMILASPDGTIQYVNPTSVETLRRLESLLPCKATELVGRSVDIFHKHPEHQRRIIGDPKNLPHRATIRLGEDSLDLLVSAVYDEKKNFAGTMLTWEIVTEKLRLAREAAQAKSMVDNAPINIMLADRDFFIRSMNPASLATLKKIENLLPCRAEEVIGSNIDIFHKRPEHQRRLLADPKNLPHRANIKLGDETLDLLVSPIYDEKRNYMGPMVTWEVITERVAAAEWRRRCRSASASSNRNCRTKSRRFWP